MSETAVEANAQEAATATVPTNSLDQSVADPVSDDTPNETVDSNSGIDTDNVRIGTISSARFNILSTMVGGGCLSLPLAFQESGNALVGPLMLLFTGVVTEFCFKRLVASAVHLNQPHQTIPGHDTFESITSAAFGNKAYVMSMGLVVLMCFFGTVGYSVLLRDMMEPLNDAIVPRLLPPGNGEAFVTWIHRNFTMFLIVILVTPFCTLRRLTALKDCGAASMLSLLILGTCIVIRSVQCNLGTIHTSDVSFVHFYENDPAPWYTYLRLFPESWHDLLNALPLFISCFVCHYNILPVHNELQDPTPKRVSWWLTSTTWFAVGLYMIMGFAGSAYAHCTPTGKVQGNILLDFDEHDPLLMVGRMCLAVTITLAFPMLVIPGRDICVRSIILPKLQERRRRSMGDLAEDLAEPLLEHHDDDEEVAATTNDETEDALTLDSISFGVLLSISVVIFWSAAALASLVSSIDVVWDLLGSSLSILMSYLIPAGTYLVLVKRQEGNVDETTEESSTRGDRLARCVCWVLLGVSFPLMVVSTANAIYNTFF